MNASKAFCRHTFIPTVRWRPPTVLKYISYEDTNFIYNVRCENQHTSLFDRLTPVWISLQATPMANRVSNHAINEVAAAAARVSVRHSRKWWAPANVEAMPTTLAINANVKNADVTLLPGSFSDQSVLMTTAILLRVQDTFTTTASLTPLQLQKKQTQKKQQKHKTKSKNQNSDDTED